MLVPIHSFVSFAVHTFWTFHHFSYLLRLVNSVSVLRTMSLSVQEIAAKAQQGVLDSIPAKWKLDPSTKYPSNVLEVPRSCGLLTPRQIEITEQKATALLAKMADASLSSVEVTEAFLARAAIAHQLVIVLILEAFIETYEYLDELFDCFLS
jgi:hypothetical protein